MITRNVQIIVFFSATHSGVLPAGQHFNFTSLCELQVLLTFIPMPSRKLKHTSDFKQNRSSFIKENM